MNITFTTVWPSKIRPLVKKQMLTDFFQKWMEQFFSNFDMLFSTIIASNFWIDTPLAHSWPCHWAKRPWPPWWCTPWTWWPTPHWRRPSLSPYWIGKSYIGPKVHLAQHPIVLEGVAWQGRHPDVGQVVPAPDLDDLGHVVGGLIDRHFDVKLPTPELKEHIICRVQWWKGFPPQHGLHEGLHQGGVVHHV